MENINDRPIEIDTYCYREWHLLEEEEPTKDGEYLVTVATDFSGERRYVDIWYWLGKQGEFIQRGMMGVPENWVVGWSELPTPCLGG